MSSNSIPNEVKSSESPMKNYRNWSNLPFDVSLMIFMKLGSLEILESVQFVCKMWYILCKEPSIWRTIHIYIRNQVRLNREIKYEKMLFNAIDRSDGRLTDLHIVGFGSNEICSYIASRIKLTTLLLDDRRSTQLKRLRFSHYLNISDNALIEALEKLSYLEELELNFCSFQNKKPIPIINACPSLTTFKFNKLANSIYTRKPCNEEALAIARSMPELRHLQLIENSITIVGLTAILDACPHLQSLEIRACFHLKPTKNLRKRLLEQIKDLQFYPCGSAVDYDHFIIDFLDDYCGEINSDDENNGADYLCAYDQYVDYWGSYDQYADYSDDEIPFYY
ncbi:putative F-box/LRR-repeat protein 9 [Silene latifolia]|uniref:putative F-box/LRR-repeat protein 9 n=1 Tax=Silene latifolia TaxID=37657 RepID=UPI003D77C378